MDTFDAIVVGSGPNGLVAAAILGRAGWRVAVLERAPIAGGAVRSEELTRPGYVHDNYSAFYGILHGSPVFTELELDRRLEWRTFSIPVAALTSPDEAGLIHAGTEATAAGLGADGDNWRELRDWWSDTGRNLFDLLMGALPPSPVSGLRLLRSAGLRGSLASGRRLVEPMESLARRTFSTEPARLALACGVSHTDLAVDQAGSVPLGLYLAMVAQEKNMPVPVGGARRLAEALQAAVTEAGGEIRTGCEVTRIVVERKRAVAVETTAGSVAARRAVLADVGPEQLLRRLVREDQLPSRYRDGLRAFRYGSGVFKVDLALDGPAPWNVDALRECGVVHVTGDLDNMARSAFEVRRGWLPARPLLIVGQQSVADPSRAPSGGHTLWIEMHVPARPRGDAAGRIAGREWSELKQPFFERVMSVLEEHAPGLGGKVAGSAALTPAELEAQNPNLVGGDLGSGSTALDQMAVFRPVPGWFRHATPIRGLYLCSASTHPGGGVHGRSGRACAHRVLADARLRRLPAR